MRRSNRKVSRSTRRRDALLVFVAGVTLALIWAVRRKRPIFTRDGELRELVDVASDDSFPASDPPAWTTGRESDAPWVLPGR